jgi:hypothetical protein
MATPGPAAGERRIALWLAAVAALAYLPFDHCHFTASDELGVFDPAVALYTHGTLAVPSGVHVFWGRDGRLYSHFAIGQSVLALPFLAAADALTHALAPETLRKAIGRDHVHFIDTQESPAIFFVSAYAPLATGALVAIFYAFQRGLGVGRRAALAAAALLGATSYVAAQSVYFLQHTSEAVAILGGLAALQAWRRTGRAAWLAAGCALASSVVLIRIPAAACGPALAGYLAWTLFERARERGLDYRRVAAAILLPSAAIAAIHVAVNHAKWGYWLDSPMLEQSGRFDGSLFEGLAGLVLSPGGGLLAYSPLLLLLPLWLPAFWRAHRAECATILALAASFLILCGRYTLWHGLWSAPGPRYVFALTPLLLLPLGTWLELPRPRWQRALAALLAALGGVTQLALIAAPWRGALTRLGFLDDFAQGRYPSPAFLFDPWRSPILAHLRGLFAGEIDAWLWALWFGVGRAPQRALACALFAVWALAFALCASRLRRSIAADPALE